MLRRHELPLLLTGLLATLCGIGLPRLGYTALMPEMVQSGWFSGQQVAYLGAANLLGYLLGALAAAPLAERLGTVRTLALCWLGVALSFAACIQPQPMAWFLAARLLSGLAGAMLAVIGPSFAMAAIPAERRAAIGPLIFCGVGLGALLSASLLQFFSAWPLGWIWAGLALVSLLAGGLGWRCARRLVLPECVPFSPSSSANPSVWSLPLLLILLAYGTDAFGFIPHTVFWVDYLSRELQLGTAYGASQWALFGLGAIAGPLCVSFCASRWGWWRSCTLAYGLKALAIALPLVWASWSGHALSGFLVGALTPGMAAITSGYLMVLVGAQQHRRLWGYATAGFALLQAASGYLMAWLYTASHSYRPLFLLGAAALALGCLLVAGLRLTQPAVKPSTKPTHP